MLLLLIIALIATPAFFRQAKSIGIHPGKVACIPFVAAGMLLVFGNLAALAIAEVSRRAGASESTDAGAKRDVVAFHQAVIDGRTANSSGVAILFGTTLRRWFTKNISAMCNLKNFASSCGASNIIWNQPIFGGSRSICFTRVY